MIVSEISSHSCVVCYPTAHSREAFKMDRDSQCDWEMARKQEAGAPLLGLCRGQGQEPGKAGWVVAAVKGRGPCTEILRPKQERGPREWTQGREAGWDFIGRSPVTDIEDRGQRVGSEWHGSWG